MLNFPLFFLFLLVPSILFSVTVATVYKTFDPRFIFLISQFLSCSIFVVLLDFVKNFLYSQILLLKDNKLSKLSKLIGC